MATNLSIDPELLDRALEVSGERTKKAAVTLAPWPCAGKRSPTRRRFERYEALWKAMT